MKDEIRKILGNVAHIDVSPEHLSDEGDLYEAGLSSLNTIHLMLAIEKNFNIAIPDELLTRELFSSIDSLADAVSQLQRQQALEP